jgi:hypothetical protein
MAEPHLEDEAGFDPFREERPSHEPMSVAELIPRRFLDPPGPDNPKPDPKQLKCSRCSASFASTPVWFAGKWRLNTICMACADGNTLKAMEYDRPPVRQLSCPRCGIRRGTEPVLKHNLWHYELSCSHCGATTLNVYRVRRTCDTCQEKYNINDKHPSRTCHKCSQRDTKVF